MPRKVEYVHYAHGVKVTKNPDSRGHRVRFTRPDGRGGEARRTSWEEAHELALELSGLISQQSTVKHDAPISMLAEMFLDPANHRRTPSHTYMRSSKSVINRWIIPTIGDTPCSHWDATVTQQVVDACQDAGLADSTVSGVVRTMAGIARMGREHGMLPHTAEPTRNVVRHARTQVDVAELPTADDVERVAVAASTVTGQWWRRLQVQTGAYSGLRIGEVLGLQVGDINVAEGTIRVERQQCAAGSGLIDPKYGSSRTTIFPSWLDDDYAKLVEGRKAKEPLFPAARGGHEIYSTFLNQRWRPAVIYAGWPRATSGRGFRWSYHDLRHYFCTWALSRDGLGMDVADVSRFAGHKNPQITWQVYVQGRPDRVARARQASGTSGR